MQKLLILGTSFLISLTSIAQEKKTEKREFKKKVETNIEVNTNEIRTLKGKEVERVNETPEHRERQKGEKEVMENKNSKK